MPATKPYSREDGIKAYSKLGLRVYDPLIMGAVTRYVWECPSDVFVEFYRRHVTANHADIGVGTGYVLDRCGLIPATRLALVDLQPNCLEYAARRLKRYQPEQYLWEAGFPLPNIAPFDSIGLGGILHCLPGDMRQKGKVFDALKSICSPGATFFGYTLVNDAIQASSRRRFVYRHFHRMQVVNFEHDNLCDLTEQLSQRCDDYSVELVGCFAFFTAVYQNPALAH
jgi:hypothetical protein